MTRRTAGIAGIIAFVVVDGILVALALRATGSPSPADEMTSVTVTRTVVGSPAGAAGLPASTDDGRSV